MHLSERKASPQERRSRAWQYVLILGIVTALGPLSIDTYLPAFPQIATDFGVPIGTVQLSLSLFLVGIALGQILHGPISDRRGRKPQLQLGTAMFAISAVGCAWAGSIGSLIFWRTIMALGASAGMVVARAVVRDLFDEIESARYFSSLMMITASAPIVAPLLGGQVLKYIGWRGIFAGLALCGLIGLVAVTFWLEESLPVSRRRKDSLGQTLRGYAGLLRNGPFMSAALALGFAYGVLFAYITGASAVFIVGFGISPQQFGLFFGANAVGMVTCSTINRRLVLRHRPRAIANVAYAMFVAVGVVLAVIGATGQGGLWTFAPVLLVVVSLLGMLLPNLAAMALSPFQHQAGSASALLGMGQFALGGLVGTIVSLIPGRAVIPSTAMIAVSAAAGVLALWLGRPNAAAVSNEPQKVGKA